MKIYYTCSNCGQHFQTSAMMGVPDGMYFSGCRVVGDAFYCEDCVKTWADRNGKPFDEQYADPRGMFTKWWNRMVDEQAKVEGKTVKKYRVVNGEYITECEITECDYHDACKVRGQELQELFEDDPDIYESLLDDSWWDDLSPEVFICLYT